MIGKLFFGTQTGTTQLVADQIKEAMSDLIQESKNIYGTKKEEIAAADFLVLGGSTWGDGELTDDWADFLPSMGSIDLTGKKVALFGLGDQYSYSYNFVSSMKLLYDQAVACGAEIIVQDVPIAGFEFDHSEALIDGNFMGLVVDEVNQPELTSQRITEWAGKVRAALGAVAV